MITNKMSVRHSWLGACALAIMAVFVGSQSAVASIMQLNDSVYTAKSIAVAPAKRAGVKRALVKRKSSARKVYRKKKYTKRKKLRTSRTSRRAAGSRKYTKRRYARKSNKRRSNGRNHGRGSLMATLRSVKPAGLPLRLAAAVVTVESGWRVNARGSSGERGLMQLMPATARMMGARGNLYNPRINMRAGTKYLNWCYRRARKNVAATIGCYNRGPGLMWKWSGNPITRRYVKKVRRYMGRS